MKIINLTPHSVDIYAREAYINLEEQKGGVLLADGIDPDAVGLSLPSVGIARVKTSVAPEPPRQIGGEDLPPIFRTTWGDLEGLPPLSIEDGELLLIVSPIFKSAALEKAHPRAGQMVCPHGAVRLRSNTSQVLGCMGLTY